MAGPGYPSNWEELRQQQLQHDNHRCCTCGITAKQLIELGWAPLQVHHINEGPPHYAGPYRREVVGTNLMTLCPDCHDGVTDSVRKQRYRLDPSKQVEITTIDHPETPSRESATRPAVQISVTEDNPTPERQSTARRIDINLFS